MAVLALTFSFSGCGKEVVDNEKINLNSEEEKMLSFEESLSEFNISYKKALLSTGKEQKEEAEKTTRQSYEAWKRIVKNFSNNKPEEYIQEEDWINKLNELNLLEEEALEDVLAGNLFESHEKLELVRKRIKELRTANGIRNIGDDMLSFHDVMEEVANAETKEKAMEHFTDLKINFTVLKEYNQDDIEYNKAVNELSNVISEIESSVDTTFIRFRDKLKPAFIALYMQFG